MHFVGFKKPIKSTPSLLHRAALCCWLLVWLCIGTGTGLSWRATAGLMVLPRPGAEGHRRPMRPLVRFRRKGRTCTPHLASGSRQTEQYVYALCGKKANTEMGDASQRLNGLNAIRSSNLRDEPWPPQPVHFTHITQAWHLRGELMPSVERYRGEDAKGSDFPMIGYLSA